MRWFMSTPEPAPSEPDPEVQQLRREVELKTYEARKALTDSTHAIVKAIRSLTHPSESEDEKLMRILRGQEKNR